VGESFGFELLAKLKIVRGSHEERQL